MDLFLFSPFPVIPLSQLLMLEDKRGRNYKMEMERDEGWRNEETNGKGIRPQGKERLSAALTKERVGSM